MRKGTENRTAALLKKGLGAYRALSERNYTTVAGTLVFFLVLSFVPLLFWLSLLCGRSLALDRLFTLRLFDWAHDLVVYLSVHAQDAAAGVNLLFLGTTLWSGTGFFYHLRRSGELIYGVKRAKQGWKLRILAVFITFAVLLYFAFALAVIVGTDLLTESLPVWLKNTVLYAVLLVFAFFGAWLLNAYACPYRVSPQATAVGSAFTALSALLATVVFGIYLSFAHPERLYGALSVVIVFLLYLYWLMICFVAGMICNFHRMRTRTLQAGRSD